MVVATTHDAPRLLRCVESIARGAGAVPHEVVLVLSGADDDVVEAARALKGARLAESRWNLGFAGACNLGRAEARGELIVLLHDDAEAEEGWLPALVEAAEQHPDAGVIGSRVLAGDGGSLQLAGAVIFSDASTVLLGRGAAPEAPEHMVSRPIDYSSSASLLVRARTWDAIGGADELLFPGGYVDADLCIAAWAAGWEVRYEPVAAARHRQGGSMTAGFKAFAHERSRDRFRRKWAAELEGHEPPAADVAAATRRALARAEARAAELASRPRPVAAPALPDPDLGPRPRAVAAPAPPDPGPRPRAVAAPAPPDPGPRPRAVAAPAPPDPDLGPRLATLELRLLREYVATADAELRLLREYAATTDPELERVRGEYEAQRRRLESAEAELLVLRERARALDAVLAGGWWRLRERLLPVIRLVRRLRRSA